jgi:hypothetical protein
MALETFKADFKRQLRKNPQLPPPLLSTKRLTLRQLHRYKKQLRAFDAVRLEMNLATPARIQRENSAVAPAFRPRILRFSQHA